MLGRIYFRKIYIYINTGVIHVWYIRCDRDVALEMIVHLSFVEMCVCCEIWWHCISVYNYTPMNALKGLRICCTGYIHDGPVTIGGPRDPRCWMAGLAWRLAGGGGSVDAILCNLVHCNPLHRKYTTCKIYIYRTCIYIYIYIHMAMGH